MTRRALHGAVTRHGAPMSLRALADQVFSRAAGAQLVEHNGVRLLKDGRENYPAWLAAIHGARRTVLLESYIFYNDRTGNQFADALIDRARQGVRVRVLYDWLGVMGNSPFSRRFWNRMKEAGIEVRCYNPPRLDSPLGWIGRDHRKMVAVDGEVAFVSGLCIGDLWAGDPGRGREPWRDTGVEVRGPAVADIEDAFADVWATLGDPIPEAELTPRDSIPPAGDFALRVVAGTPYTAGLFRMDQLIASLARERLWLTDAYYAGTVTYVQALIGAAAGGVDVRLLVPGKTDNPFLLPFTRSGYRPLLEAGVRVFEWSGEMIHAKTAVADGHWSRVGSSNLNLASWLGNYELDVTIEDDRFAQEMEAMYLADLENATEIVLDVRRRHVSAPGAPRKRSYRLGHASGSASRALSGALRLGHTATAAMTNRRALGPAETKVLAGMGFLALLVCLLAVFYPRVITLPVAVIGGWVAVTLFLRAYRLWTPRRR